MLGLVLVWSRVAVVVAAWCGLAVMSTLFPGAPHVGDGVVLATFVAGFSLFVVAFVAAMVRIGRNLGDLLSHLSRGWLIALGLAVVATWVLQVFSPSVPPGVPGERNGQYYVNNHGVDTAISKATYIQASTAGQRTIAGIGFVLLIAAGAMAAAAHAARKSGPAGDLPSSG